ncbi:MAG: hypothetical protein H7Z43_13445 [Clostridia bacterium]|nr:hypothetical protein [Deltaproteobacteria bacterium]
MLDKLTALDDPLVTEFFRAAADEDDDELVRVRALVALTIRGDAEATRALDTLIAGPDDLLAFDVALASLARLRGPSFYGTLTSIWRDEDRGADEKRSAMIAMEQLDAPRALQDFASAIASFGEVDSLPDDQLEMMILAFVRYDHAPGRAALEALRERLRASAASLDADQSDEMLGMVQEGIDLLNA